MSLDYNIKEYLRGLSDEDLTEVSVLLEGLRLRKKYSECPYKKGESYIVNNNNYIKLYKIHDVNHEDETLTVTCYHFNPYQIQHPYEYLEVDYEDLSDGIKLNNDINIRSLFEDYMKKQETLFDNLYKEYYEEFLLPLLKSNKK